MLSLETIKLQEQQIVAAKLLTSQDAKYPAHLISQIFTHKIKPLLKLSYLTLI